MKRLCLCFVVYLIVMALVSCGSSTKPTVMVPAGSPQLAQIYLEASGDYAIDIVQGSDPLVAAFGSTSHDFIFAPTNLGARLYRAKPDYVFICAVTFGNYFLVTKSDSVSGIQDLSGREITAFGANQTGDIILRYILEENAISVELEYVDSVQTSMSLFVADQSKIVLVAEPSLSVLETQIDDLVIINLQTEYEAITGVDSFPQAGVFAKNTLKDGTIDAFLNAISDSIESVNTNPDSASDQALALGYSYQKEVLASAIPRCNLAYRDALVVRAELETYFTIIMDVNADLIGGALPENDFYYQP